MFTHKLFNTVGINLLYTNTLLKNYMSIQKLPNTNPINSIDTFSKHHLPIFFKKSFNYFVKLNVLTQKPTLKPHHSLSTLFISSGSKNSPVTFNLSKFYHKYTNTLQFIYNVFFYNLSTFLFGNVFLKNETHSFNWPSTFKLQTRLTQILLFVLPFKRNKFSNTLLSFILTLGVKNAIIIDSLYHKTTVLFLQKISVLTIGVVPITSHYKSLDVSIPLANDNIFSQVFFIKLIFSLKKLTESQKYISYRNIWLNYL